MLAEFDGVVISGSSMAIEADVRQLHSFRNRALDVVNAARPANFDGTGHENLTKDQIGVTRALLFAALAQRVDTTKPGFVDVDAAFQEAAVAAWKKDAPPPDRAARAKAQRPDALSRGGGARHDEWIAFLAGVERPVCPRPTETTRAPMPYFFADTDGSVRLVDTRVGQSVAVKLPSVPESVHFPTVAEGAPLVVVCRDEDGARSLFEVVPGGSSGSPPRTRAIGDVHHAAGNFVDPEYGPNGMPTGRIEGASLLFVSEDKVRVRRPRGSAWIEAKPPAGVDMARAFTSFVHRDVVLVVDPATAAVHGVPLDKSVGATQVAARLGAPPGLARVQALATWNDPSHLVFPVVAIGQGGDGKPACAVLSPVPSTLPLSLPDDAVLRNLKAAPGRPGVFVVEYTLPGDVVEHGRFRSVEVDAFANLVPDDAASFSIHARLREALGD